MLHAAQGECEQDGELVLAADRLSLAHCVIDEGLAAAEVGRAQDGVDALVVASDLVQHSASGVSRDTRHALLFYNGERPVEQLLAEHEEEAA